MTTEKAPVAGPATATPATGLTRNQTQSLISQAIRQSGAAGAAGGVRDFSLSELFQRTAQAAQDQAALGRNAALGASLGQGDSGSGSGAAAAAGVLTAVDEDGEGDEEAAVPSDFEYFTDGEDDE